MTPFVLAKAAAVAFPLVELAAQTSTTAGGIDPLSIINTAAQVAFLVLFVTGRIVPSKTADDQRARAQAAEKQLADLNALVSTEVMPKIALCAHALEQITPFLQAEIAIRAAQGVAPPRGG